MIYATAAPLDYLSGPLARTTYRRTYTQPPVGVSPFSFRPPDGPAAVANCDMPPAISRPSLLRLEIAAGFLHRELTPLSHSRPPLARWRPHLHRGVCVYVCVCVCLCVCVCVCNGPLFVFLFYMSRHLLCSKSPSYFAATPSCLSFFTLTPLPPYLYSNFYASLPLVSVLLSLTSTLCPSAAWISSLCLTSLWAP